VEARSYPFAFISKTWASSKTWISAVVAKDRRDAIGAGAFLSLPQRQNKSKAERAFLSGYALAIRSLSQNLIRTSSAIQLRAAGDVHARIVNSRSPVSA